MPRKKRDNEEQEREKRLGRKGVKNVGEEDSL